MFLLLFNSDFTIDPDVDLDVYRKFGLFDDFYVDLNIFMFQVSRN